MTPLPPSTPATVLILGANGRLGCQAAQAFAESRLAGAGPGAPAGLRTDARLGPPGSRAD